MAGLMFQNKREVEQAHFKKIDKQPPSDNQDHCQENPD